MNEHSLHLNSLFTGFNKSEIITDIDYCNNPVSFLCAIEQKTYNVIFIDYHIEGVKLESLLSFIRQLSPKCIIIITSTPAGLPSEDEESLSSLCKKCCHESFSDINFREIIEYS
ncbi:hypothetical protein A3732_25375 [Oleiphilus sp. HI0050]|nr:hypothetical protein A3732_19040 [Oleiphilus sp. HI0050]KZY47454.1 hypothetical protein A3732_25375 [Oleiphilus sp. HI0050]